MPSSGIAFVGALNVESDRSRSASDPALKLALDCRMLRCFR